MSKVSERKGKYLYLFLIAIILLFSFSKEVNAQRDTGSTTTIIFDDNSSFEQYSASHNQMRNVIKVGIVSILIGDYSIYYERTLNTKLGFEIGLGITGQNFIRTAFNRDEKESPALDIYSGSKKIDYLNGPTFKLGLKYYPQAYAPEDFFMEVQFAYLGHNEVYSFEGNPLQYSNQKPLDSYRESKEFRFLLGNSTFFSWSDTWMSEFYVGAGLNFYSFDEFVLGGSEQDPTLLQFYTLSNNDIRLGLYFGWKVGPAF